MTELLFVFHNTLFVRYCCLASSSNLEETASSTSLTVVYKNTKQVQRMQDTICNIE